MIKLSNKDKVIALAGVSVGLAVILTTEPVETPVKEVYVDVVPEFVEVSVKGMPCIITDLDTFPKALCDWSQYQEPVAKVEQVSYNIEPVAGPIPGAKIEWPDTGYKKEPVVSATVSTIDPKVAEIIEPNKVTGFNYLTGKTEPPKGLL